MDDRRRFLATMHYQERDRPPICDFGFWGETLVTWYDQGLPRHVDASNTDAFFGMDSLLGCAGLNVGLCPGFEGRVLEDRGDHEVVQQGDGVRVLRKKFMGSIPAHLGHLLVDRASWNEHYKPRLDAVHPGRYPADLAAHARAWADPARPHVLSAPGGSLYGVLRNWMGLENLCMVVYDDPAWFEEMVVTLADCIVGVLERAFAAGARFDACSIWEDMCYNAGPLLAPKHFKQYLVPQYRRITDLLRKHGVDVIYVDCDGRIDHLVPLWIEGGVNCMFPIEVGVWRADAVAFRREYGKDLLLMGGFDKRILARGRREILAEIKRLAPLVEEGGFIGFCDHRVPPDVPLANYVYYLHTVREIWGGGVNLKPMDPALKGLA